MLEPLEQGQPIGARRRQGRIERHRLAQVALGVRRPDRGERARALHQSPRPRGRRRGVRERGIQQLEKQIVLGQPLGEGERTSLGLRLARLELEHAAQMGQGVAGPRQRAVEHSGTWTSRLSQPPRTAIGSCWN